MRRVACRLLLPVVALAMLMCASASHAQVFRLGSYISGEADEQGEPSLVEGLGTADVRQVEASNSASYALLTDGRVLAWGNNEEGELGDGTTNNSPLTPVEVAFPAGVDIVSIGESRSNGLAIDSTGHGWVWGSNLDNALCQRNGEVDQPVEVRGLSDLVQVQGGGARSFWLERNGDVFACGSNKEGSLGVGEGITKVTTPTLIATGAVEVSGGSTNGALRTASGEVETWGANPHGQAGTGSPAGEVWTPTPVSLPEPAIAISVGGNAASNGADFALTSAGKVYGWGDDRNGQLGNGVSGSNAESRTPVLASELSGLHVRTAIQSGTSALVITSAGELLGLGANFGGAIGQSEGRENFTVPTLVMTGVTAVSATAQDTVLIGG